LAWANNKCDQARDRADRRVLMPALLGEEEYLSG